MIWIHRFVLRHTREVIRVTVPFYDTSSKGELIRCDCGKEWAR